MRVEPAGCGCGEAGVRATSCAIQARWAERRFTDIRHWSEPPRGGHFAALEQPELFVEEVRAFFSLVR